MWDFDGTPEALMWNVLVNLELARTEEPPRVWHRNQAFVALAGRYLLEQWHAPVDERALAIFKRESGARLRELPPERVSSFVDAVFEQAVEAARDDEAWFTVSIHRSALQLLTDDYGVAFDTEELDQEIRAAVKHALPVPREWVPAKLMVTHWWWHLPDSEKGYLAFREWPPGHDLSGERLVRAMLQHARFPDGNFDGADAYGALAARIVLTGASLQGTRFNKADLVEADLRRARGDRATFNEADLTGARLDRASLRGASFIGAELRGASFAGADLTEANLSHANLRDADFTGATVRAARFDGALWLDTVRGLTPSPG